MQCKNEFFPFCVGTSFFFPLPHPPHHPQIASILNILSSENAPQENFILELENIKDLFGQPVVLTGSDAHYI